METDPLLGSKLEAGQHRTNDALLSSSSSSSSSSSPTAKRLSYEHHDEIHHEEFEADLDALLDGEALAMAMPLWQKVAIGLVFVGTFALVLTIMIGSLITDSPIQRATLAVLVWLESLPFWLLCLLLFLVFTFGTPVGLPIVPEMLVIGYLTGPYFGILISAVGTGCGALLCYGLGISLRGWIMGKIAPRPVLQALRKAVLLNSFKLVTLAHMSPIFPDTPLNYLFAAIGVEIVPYILGTLAGQAPSYIINPYIGSLSKDLLSAFFSDKGFSSVLGFWGTVAWFGFLIVANIVLTAWLTIVAKRELKQAMLEIEETELEAVVLDDDKLLKSSDDDKEPSSSNDYVPIRSPSPHSLELVVVAGDDAIAEAPTTTTTITITPTRTSPS